MSRGREYTRRTLQRIIDQALGMSPTMHGALATRQAHLSIAHKHMLPVKILSVRGFPPPPSGTPGDLTAPAMQSGGSFAFLAGYSAAAGTPQAAADATGRGGDTLRLLVAAASGGARGRAALVVLFPLTAVGSGGATGSATLTVV